MLQAYNQYAVSFRIEVLESKWTTVCLTQNFNYSTLFQVVIMLFINSFLECHAMDSICFSVAQNFTFAGFFFCAREYREQCSFHSLLYGLFIWWLLYLSYVHSNKAVNVNRKNFRFSLAIMLSGSCVENVIGDFVACNADRS